MRRGEHFESAVMDMDKDEPYVDITEKKFDEVVAAEWEGLRPDMEDFVDFRSVDRDKHEMKTIKRDRRYVEADPLAKRAEFLLMEGVDLYNWLGTESPPAIRPASEYDDVVNHTDAVAKWKAGELDPDQDVWLGIDVTTTNDKTKYKEKLRRAQDEVSEGKPSELKYVDPKIKDVKGPIRLILRLPNSPGEIDDEPNSRERAVERLTHCMGFKYDRKLNRDERDLMKRVRQEVMIKAVEQLAAYLDLRGRALGKQAELPFVSQEDKRKHIQAEDLNDHYRDLVERVHNFSDEDIVEIEKVCQEDRIFNDTWRLFSAINKALKN